MSKHIAFLNIAAVALGLAALPGGASAADYYDGGDGPLAYHSRDDVYVEGGRARVEHRQDLRPAFGDRGAPGPVVFDARDPARRFDGDDGAPGYRRPGPVERPGFAYGYDRPAAFVPHRGRFDEDRYGDRPLPAYRPVAERVGPGFVRGYGGPDVGCTTEQAQSITPSGWRKTVTHRTCYQR